MTEKYDMGLIWLHSVNCNLKCEYCISSFYMDKKTSRAKIDKIIRTLDKTNKTFNVIISGGGEPFLIPNIIEVCKKLTKDHYISLNTNMTSLKIKAFSKVIDPKKVIVFTASLHYKELEKRDLLQRFITNHNLLKEKGFNIALMMVAYPPLFDYVDEYKKFFNVYGLSFFFKPFVGVYNGKTYPESYTKEEINKFNISSILNKSFLMNSKGDPCNSGYNIFLADNSGDVYACPYIIKKIGTLYNGFRISDSLVSCPEKRCICHPSMIDFDLFNKALIDFNEFSYILKLNRFKEKSMKDKLDLLSGMFGMSINRHSPKIYSILRPKNGK